MLATEITKSGKFLLGMRKRFLCIERKTEVSPNVALKGNKRLGDDNKVKYSLRRLYLNGYYLRRITKFTEERTGKPILYRYDVMVAYHPSKLGVPVQIWLSAPSGL